MSEADPSQPSIDLSVVQGDLLTRAEHALHLVPRQGMGIARRAAIYSMVAWLPIVIWAVIRGRAFSDVPDEVLVGHFAVHARFLIAVPLFVVGEMFMEHIAGQIRDNLLLSGVLRPDSLAKLRDFLSRVRRVRSGPMPWIVVAALIAVLLAAEPPHTRTCTTSRGRRTAARRRLACGGTTTSRASSS